MSGYRFSARSRQALDGVHPDLVRVAERALALTDVDFVITEGLRSAERQQALYRAGASRTMRSRHLTGHAIDVAAYVADAGGVCWDWPLYERIASAFKRAAAEMGIEIVWGGDWVSLRDGPHFELSRERYP